jgi:hypothetical protein
MSCFAPILDSKTLDVNVMGAFSRLVSVDHFYGGLFVVFTEDGGVNLSEAKLSQDGAEICGNFGFVKLVAVLVCVFKQ